MELHSARQISQVKHLWSPSPSQQADSPAALTVHRAHCVWPEKTGPGLTTDREREMVFGETLQAAGNHVVLDKTVCAALSSELGPSNECCGDYLVSLQIFSHGLFIH